MNTTEISEGMFCHVPLSQVPNVLTLYLDPSRGPLSVNKPTNTTASISRRSVFLPVNLILGLFLPLSVFFFHRERGGDRTSFLVLLHTSRNRVGEGLNEDDLQRFETGFARGVHNGVGLFSSSLYCFWY